MTEEWKDIPGYEGYYQISNYGNVRSLDREVRRSDGVVQNRAGRKIPVKVNDDGYEVVRLSRDGERHQFGVHTLVAKAFVDGYFDGAEVNHIDCVRRNNHSQNLEWVTHAENIAHAIACGRHISQNRSMKGEDNPNYGNHRLHERYASNPALAKESQSRPGAKNGRAVPIRIELPSGKMIFFEYIGQCAKKMIELGLCKAKGPESVASNISKAAKEGRKYLGCKFYIVS